jgi:hypothetical protein
MSFIGNVSRSTDLLSLPRRARLSPALGQQMTPIAPDQWVLAPLRHRQFFSLAEANAALAEKIEEWNNRPFEAIERDKLKPLSAAPFVVGQWLVARVNIDYHVAVDGHFYSVPYRLVHRRLDVFLTATAVANVTRLRAILDMMQRLGASGRSPAKKLSMVKRRARAHGRCRALHLE